MFEVHGWLELIGSEDRGQGVIASIRQICEPPSEWSNGLLVAFPSNGRRFIHLARLWNHREVGETAVEELCATLGSAVRGKIDVLDHDELRTEVWWVEGGRLEREPGRGSRYERWMA